MVATREGGAQRCEQGQDVQKQTGGVWKKAIFMRGKLGLCHRKVVEGGTKTQAGATRGKAGRSGLEEIIFMRGKLDPNLKVVERRTKLPCLFFENCSAFFNRQQRGNESFRRARRWKSILVRHIRILAPVNEFSQYVVFTENSATNCPSIL